MYQAMHQGRCLLALLLALGFSGCRLLGESADELGPAPEEIASAATEPAKDKDTDESEPAAALQAALASDIWVSALPAMDAGDEAQDTYRWRHANLEDFLNRPGMAADLHQALGSPNPTIRANAAIGLARLGAVQPIDELAAAVEETTLKLPLRLAAAETLGRCEAAAASQRLRMLLAKFGRFDGEFSARYVPELHAELVTVLAKREVSEPLLAAALRSPSPTARLAAAKIWAAHKTPTVPEELLDLATDGDARVRAAALAALALNGHPQAGEHVRRALGDAQLSVRLAAIEALGVVGDPAARQELQRLLSHDAEAIRAAAVAALATMNVDEALLSAAKDKSWRVRLEVAQALTSRHDSRLSELADDLLRDPSPLVQQRMVESLANWPSTQAGPLLLLAMEESSYLARKAARERLARHWPRAEAFVLDASNERRAEMLAQLRTRWREDHAGAAIEQLTSHVKHLQQATSVAAESLAVVERLASDDLNQRRQAADDLLEQASAKPLEASLVELLAQRMEAEPDALVWRSVLEAVEGNSGEAALRLACAAIGHPAAEVRRRACEHLARHAEPRHVQVLLPSLEDSDTSVIKAAARALGTAGDPAAVASLEQLLNASDKTVRIEAAMSLCRLEAESGPAALERLAVDSDPAVRRQAATAMGQVADAAFAATLIRLLDDQGGVRMAALASLPQVAGRDIAGDSNSSEAPADVTEAIRRWKAWEAAGSVQRAVGSKQ